jgi:hypothetical protein
MLTNKQKRVATAIYQGQLSDEQIGQQYGVSVKRLAGWREEPEFGQYIDQLCESTGRETRCILSRYGPLAAMRLAELIGSDKPDMARRAALDLIDRCLRLPRDGAGEPVDGQAASDPAATLTDEQARELLQAIVEPRE